uniref:Uncharacterized protein n=1 Tax=Cyprinus carpio TaxID=7962 RepID=A0A8C2GAS6_CYPCA
MDKIKNNDLQGTDGSGSLGGLDVRRQIPIKLLSKQTERGKLPTRPQRPDTRLPSKNEEVIGEKHKVSIPDIYCKV